MESPAPNLLRTVRLVALAWTVVLVCGDPATGRRTAEPFAGDIAQMLPQAQATLAPEINLGLT